MEVSTMFYICRYCVFTWGGRNKEIGLYPYSDTCGTPRTDCYTVSLNYIKTFALVSDCVFYVFLKPTGRAPQNKPRPRPPSGPNTPNRPPWKPEQTQSPSWPPQRPTQQPEWPGMNPDWPPQRPGQPGGGPDLCAASFDAAMHFDGRVYLFQVC